MSIVQLLAWKPHLWPSFTYSSSSDLHYTELAWLSSGLPDNPKPAGKRSGCSGARPYVELSLLAPKNPPSSPGKQFTSSIYSSLTSSASTAHLSPSSSQREADRTLCLCLPNRSLSTCLSNQSLCASPPATDLRQSPRSVFDNKDTDTYLNL